MTQSILLIDDEVDIREFVCEAVSLLNMRCFTTGDTAEFLSALSEDYTFVIIDLMIPGVDGIELLRLLAKEECRAKVILMSGADRRIVETAEKLARSLGLAVAGHLLKPFTIQNLQALLTPASQPEKPASKQPPARMSFSDGEIRGAIDREEFILHYQPQVEMLTGHIGGVEALVRWQHPTIGLVYPDAFIAQAESSGMIDDLGWLVMRRGFNEMMELSRSCKQELGLSINVSVHTLHDLSFPDRLLELARSSGMPPEKITVEITESGLISKYETALDVLTRLRMKSVSLSIDDFGTGYSMMRQLHNIPATELKIDRAFVQNMHINIEDRILVQKTIQIGRELGLKVVAEGVETARQIDSLREWDCDVVQGYYFSQPIAASQLQIWLEENCGAGSAKLESCARA